MRFIYKKLPKKDRDPCRDAATTELQRLLLFSLADLTVLRYHHTILNRLAESDTAKHSSVLLAH
nr:hypothetical protein [Bacillus licheniformis]